jgi:outer membrane protein OmpA-like peptidoglycan-associated protein
VNRTLLALLALSFGLNACAPKVPMELEAARRAYAGASGGTAAQLVPAELHKAKQALAEAEVAFLDDPRGFHTLDLAYVAQRKAELSVALAAHASESATAEDANAQYQVAQDGIMQNTKAKLGESQANLSASQADLAASETAGATTRAQLSASEEARLLAEKRAADALAALAKLAAVKEEARGLVITLSGSVIFASGESVLLPAAEARLGQVADALLASEDRTILIEGHTDSQGSYATNLDLSKRRAEAVRNFLVTRGATGSQVRAVGIGEARPIADNNTPEGRANNRRVEVILEPVAAASLQ